MTIRAPSIRPQARGAFQCEFGSRAEPDRRMRFLCRLRFHRDIGEIPEIAADSRFGLSPQRLHYLHSFDEPAPALFARHSENLVRRRRTANTDSDDQTAPAQLIDRCQGLRQLHRIADNRQQHGSAEAYARRQRRDVCEERDRLEDRRVGNHLFLHHKLS